MSVSQLNEYVRKSLAGDPMLQHICITGELTGFKQQASGHWYFALKDENAAVNCVMFRQNNRMVAFTPENGDQIRLFGSVGLYAKTGAYQFYGDAMEKAGLGELFLKFEAMKRRLSALGLFDAASKKPLPLLPRGIGIVTSSTGAVIHDIARVAWRRFPGMPLFLYPVKVQGEGAAEEIAHGLEVLDALPETEVLIVGRGGGSMEDLWAFNEEVVARSIYRCKKPVVSAVGHETDFTIADFTADVRAATPSMAAELAVPVKEDLLEEIRQIQEELDQAAFRELERRLHRVNLLEERIKAGSPLRRCELLVQRLNHATARMRTAEEQFLIKRRFRLEKAELQIRTSGVASALDRGFTVATRGGKTLRSAGELVSGDEIVLHFRDGRARTRVLEIEMAKAGKDEEIGRKEEEPKL